jgi:aminoglycoside phosphotransferase (APT) family kinase protein
MGGPSEESLSWAESAVGQPVTGTRGLRRGGTPWLLRFGDGTEAVLRGGGGFGTEVAALRQAATCGIPAPRLVAVSDSLLMVSVVAGSSKIPLHPPAGRLAALGAVAARLHAAELVPSNDLPLRHRPIAGVDFDQWRERDGAPPVVREATDAVARLPRPVSRPVFVHGDLWQGNTMWVDGELAAVVDWDCAGAGHPGVDLGSLRCDAAVMFGVSAADAVSAGWQRRPGERRRDEAYWDLVAALSTPPDLVGWEETIQDQGPEDLDGPTMTTRRDAFERAALSRLG